MSNVALKRNSEPRIKLVPEIKAKTTPKKVKESSVVKRVQVVFRKNNKLAIIGGFLFGAIPPISTFTVAHYAVISGDVRALAGQFASYFVLGGLVYSSITVYQWKLEAVQSRLKALGFVLLTEGVMTFIHIPWLCYVALFQLVVINWIANSYNLTVDKV